MNISNSAEKRINIRIKFLLFEALALQHISQGRFLWPHIVHIEVYVLILQLLALGGVLFQIHLQSGISNFLENVLISSAPVLEHPYSGLGASPEGYKPIWGGLVKKEAGHNWQSFPRSEVAGLPKNILTKAFQTHKLLVVALAQVVIGVVHNLEKLAVLIVLVNIKPLDQKIAFNIKDIFCKIFLFDVPFSFTYLHSCVILHLL